MATKQEEFLLAQKKKQEDNRAVKFTTGITSAIIDIDKAMELALAGAVNESDAMAQRGIDRSFKVVGLHAKDNTDWTKTDKCEWRSRGVFLQYGNREALYWITETKKNALDLTLGNHITLKTVVATPGMVTFKINTTTDVITQTIYGDGGFILSNNTSFGRNSSLQELYLESLKVNTTAKAETADLPS